MADVLNGLWVQVFRTGTHTDAFGRTSEWTTVELDLIADKYDPELLEAPYVIGHPYSNDQPAYGWVREVRRQGNYLEARAYDVDEDFEQDVRTGKYRKRSISLSRNLYLLHVGWLGAANPAIPGLKDVKFSTLAESESKRGTQFFSVLEEPIFVGTGNELDEKDKPTVVTPEQALKIRMRAFDAMLNI